MVDEDQPNITLWCNATGNPKPSITWKKIGNSSVILSSEKNLTISHVRIRDGGVYACTAENGLGKSLTEVVHLNVICKYSSLTIELFTLRNLGLKKINV